MIYALVQIMSRSLIVFGQSSQPEGYHCAKIMVRRGRTSFTTIPIHACQHSFPMVEPGGNGGFFQDPDVQASQQRGGMLGQPVIHFWTRLESYLDKHLTPLLICRRRRQWKCIMQVAVEASM